MVAVEKNEEMVGKRISVKCMANDAEQTIEGLSHING